MSASQKTEASSSTAASLSLQAVGVLSAVVFALNFGLEFMAVFQQSRNHQFVMVGLLNCLALWAFVEAVLFRRRSKADGSRRLSIIVFAQLVTECVRAVGMVLWLDKNAAAIAPSTFYVVAPSMFLPVYLLIFLAISRTLINTQTGELRNAYLTIVKLEQSALKLTEAIPVGTYVVEVSPDGRRRFTFVSKRWLEMLDFDLDEAMADANITRIRIHPDDLASYIAREDATAHGLEQFQWEGRIVVREAVKWVLVEAIPRKLIDGALAFEGVMIDVTEHKAAQSALQRTYEQLTDAAISNSRAEEREKLLQDMHDGFGSQLASARILARRDQLSSTDLAILLEECIADLHLFTDTLSNEAPNLHDGLADLRYRINRRVNNLDVKINWNIAPKEDVKLSPQIVLQILRIVQEALNNALKHADAQNISVNALIEPYIAALKVEVIDDGIGMPDEPRKGRGLLNMQHRAREINAKLEIASAAKGSHLRLSVPLQVAR